MSKIIISLASLVFLSGCVPSIKVTGEIPQALIPTLPLNATLELSDEFRRYNYKEEKKGRGIKSLEFGDAQVLLFTQIFGQLLNLKEAGESGVDLRISPELLDFQYSVPRETSLKLYEVFIKYRVKLSDQDGEEIADWVVKGYGKTPTALLPSAVKAFNSATNVALRDVGAQLSIGFDRQDAIKEILKRKEAKAAGESIEQTAEAEQLAEAEVEQTGEPEETAVAEPTESGTTEN